MDSGKRGLTILTNKVRDIERNEQIHSRNTGTGAGFEPRTSERKANNITTELKRIRPSCWSSGRSRRPLFNIVKQRCSWRV